jgi:hypothetical protein
MIATAKIAATLSRTRSYSHLCGIKSFGLSDLADQYPLIEIGIIC